MRTDKLRESGGGIRTHDLFVPNDIISTFTDAEDVGHDGNERPTLPLPIGLWGPVTAIATLPNHRGAVGIPRADYRPPRGADPTSSPVGCH
jgi:hypothetical protein